MLQEILFGTFVPPESTSRIHRIGFAGRTGYKPPKPKKQRSPTSKEATGEKIVLAALKNSKTPLTSCDMERLVGMTRNHCGILLGNLFKQGLVTRTKQTRCSTRFYLYTAK